MRLLKHSKKPLGRPIICDALVAQGYAFTDKEPKKVLGIRLYKMSGVQVLDGGLFSGQAKGRGLPKPESRKIGCPRAAAISESIFIDRRVEPRHLAESVRRTGDLTVETLFERRGGHVRADPSSLRKLAMPSIVDWIFRLAYNSLLDGVPELRRLVRAFSSVGPVELQLGFGFRGHSLSKP